MKTTSHSTWFCLYSRAAVLGCAIGIAVGVALHDFAVGAAGIFAVEVLIQTYGVIKQKTTWVVMIFG
jgi:hypothetical protein